jgi:hypothetical protein
MPYFTTDQDRGERITKVLADVFCALLPLIYSIVCSERLPKVDSRLSAPSEWS